MSKKKARRQTSIQQDNISFNTQIQELFDIADRRIGGSNNIKGIGFQLLYSTLIILKNLLPEGGSTIQIRLEGIEDLDLHIGSSNEYIQIKTSINTIDANKFWSLGVLQNFYEVYKIDNAATFRIVHNSNFTAGMLDFFKSKNLSNEALNYWHDKFLKSTIDISKADLLVFLQRITTEKLVQGEVYSSIVKELNKKFNINFGTELNYIRALFYHIFDWATKRQTISAIQFSTLIQTITESFSKFPTNQAIQNEWISIVSYQVGDYNNDDHGYYDGKAARPIDIALGLNVRRPQWENEIIKSIKLFDVTVVKSSSGQGKSTLAYQVGKAFAENGNNIYKINFCPSYNEAIQIYGFIQGRLSIGESLIIIIDGVNQSLFAWNIIAEKLRSLPVRIIITTREEDWKRYSGDINTIAVNEINISLSEHEAKDIFKGLKANGKVKQTISDWQPIWERVKDKGLLIEYVFLLTQGQMIYERLTAQIKKLNSEVDAGAKLEILRLITLADVLNIRLKTTDIINHIQNNIQFTTDRNELFKQLEREYYISFDKSYIEGLHPVRSRHIVDILNNNLEIETTLLTLLKIIDSTYVYDFFINLFLSFPSIDKDYFCKKSAVIVSKMELTNIVYAIDGIMHIEPYKYWIENKEIYDEAFSRGGFELFVANSLPFGELHILDNLAEGKTETIWDNIKYLAKLAKRLPKFAIENSFVYKFVNHLQYALKERENIDNLEGVAFLYKWFRQVNVPFPDIADINEDELLQIIETKGISESSEIFHFYHLSKPIEYAQFLQKHYTTIIGWIKRKTNTLSIYEDGSDIYMNYLLDNNNNNTNECSVYRIDIVHSFLPNYSRYCTKVIILPFPNEHIYKAVVQNSIKHIPSENLYDNFDVHINQIWLRTIERQYVATSIYEWQKQYYDFRRLFIELAQTTIRLLEASLEGNNSRIKNTTTNFILLCNKFLNEDRLLKRYFFGSVKYFERNIFEKEELAIRRFWGSIRNFFSQFVKMFTESNFHLPIVNLNEAVYCLSDFQSSFQTIINKTYSYINFTSICEEEDLVLNRLVSTTKFYRNYKLSDTNNRTVIVARREIENWRENELKRELDELHFIIQKMNENSNFLFYPPNKIKEEGNLKYAVIGVSGCEITNEEQLLKLSIVGMLLADTDVSFFTFVFINEKKTNFALRFSRYYFKRLIDLTNGEETEGIDFEHPIPVIPDKELLGSLDEISLNSISTKKEDEDLYKMLIDVWKLSEYRNRLQIENVVQKNWLKELEVEYSSKIESIVLKIDTADEINMAILNKVSSFLQFETNLSQNEIVDLMLQKAKSTIATA